MTRGALYKTLHDARHRLRAYLASVCLGPGSMAAAFRGAGEVRKPLRCTTKWSWKQTSPNGGHHGQSDSDFTLDPHRVGGRRAGRRDRALRGRHRERRCDDRHDHPRHPGALDPQGCRLPSRDGQAVGRPRHLDAPGHRQLRRRPAGPERAEHAPAAEPGRHRQRDQAVLRRRRRRPADRRCCARTSCRP